jgi:L-asparagine transporter-like permease
MSWLILFWNLFTSSLFSFMEIKFDDKAKKLFLRDGKIDSKEHALIHDDQIFQRGIFWAISQLTVAMFIVYFIGEDAWELLASSILQSLAFIWIFIDIFAARIMLDKPWWFVGSTAKVDKIFNNPWVNWGIKISFLLISTLLTLSYFGKI